MSKPRNIRLAKRTDRPRSAPSSRVETATEAELRLESLLRKLAAWLVQQPDWVFLLAQDRHVRKQTGTAVADMLTRIPQRQQPGGLLPGQVLEVPNKNLALSGSGEETGGAVKAPEPAPILDPEGDVKADLDGAERLIDMRHNEYHDLGGEG